MVGSWYGDCSNTNVGRIKLHLIWKRSAWRSLARGMQVLSPLFEENAMSDKEILQEKLKNDVELTLVKPAEFNVLS